MERFCAAMQLPCSASILSLADGRGATPPHNHCSASQDILWATNLDRDSDADADRNGGDDVSNEENHSFDHQKKMYISVDFHNLQTSSGERLLPTIIFNNCTFLFYRMHPEHVWTSARTPLPQKLKTHFEQLQTWLIWIMLNLNTARIFHRGSVAATWHLSP